MDHSPVVKGEDHQNVPGRVVPEMLGCEIQREYLVGVRCQERPPRRLWSRPTRDHVSTDRRCAMDDAKLELHLEGDSVLAPFGVVGGDAANELDVLTRNPWTTYPSLRPIPPIVTISLSMPTKNGIGLDDDDRRSPSVPVPTEPNPEQSIGSAKPWSRCVSSENLELLS